MVLLPDGKQMTVLSFMTLHGSELAAYPDAQIAIQWPASHCNDGARNVLEAFVVGAAGILAEAIFRRVPGVGFIGAIVGHYYSKAATASLCKMFAHPASVEIVTGREILEGHR